MLTDGATVYAPKATGSVGVTVTIDAKQSLADFAAAINNTVNGSDMYKYWTTQKEAVQRATDAVKAYNAAANETNASNLIDSVNALRALTNDDLSQAVTNVKQITQMLTAFNNAGQTLGRSFNPGKSFEEMKKYFDAFDLVGSRTPGGRSTIETILTRASRGEDYSELNSQLERANSEVSRLKTNVAELKTELASVKAGNGMQELQNDLDNTRWRLESLQETVQSKNMERFETFLSSNAIKISDFVEYDDWYEQYNGKEYQFQQFADILNALSNSSIDADQAISRFKANYTELLNVDAQSNVGMEYIQSMLTTLDKVSTDTEEMKSRFGEGGIVGAITGDGAGGKQIASGELGQVVDILKQLGSVSKEVGETSGGQTSVFEQLAESLNSLSGVDTGKLETLRAVLYNLMSFKGLEVKKAPLNSIKEFLVELSNVGDVAAVRSLSGVDLKGLSEFKVSKASLSNLAEYLPQINESGVSSLKKLSEIDFTNLQNLKVSKASVANLSQLADAERMGQVLEQIQQISKMMTASASQSGAALSGEGAKVDATTAAYEKHATAVEAAANAERQKEAASDGVGSAMQTEAYSTDRATESATAHANALRTVIDTLTNVNARMAALRNNGGEGTDEYAALERVKEKLEDLRANEASFSAKHITDAMASIRLAFSEAKLDVGIFDIAAKDSAKSSTEAFKKAEESIQKYYSLLNTLDKNALAKDDIRKTESGYESKTGRYATLAADLNSASDAYKRYTNAQAMATMSSEDQERIIKLLDETQSKYNRNVEATAGKQIAASDNAQWKDALAEVKNTYDQLMSIQKEIGSRELELIKLDPEKNANEIRVLEADIKHLQELYDQLFSSDNAKEMSTEQFQNLAKVAEETASKLERIRAKQKDVAAAFGKDLAGGKAGAEFQAILEKYQQLTNASPKLAAAMQQLQNAQKILTSEDSSMNQKVQAYRDYLNVIDQVKIALSQETEEQKKRVQQDEQLKKLKEEIANAEDRYKKGFTKSSKEQHEAYQSISAELQSISAEWETLSPEEKAARLEKLTQAWKNLNGEMGRGASGKIGSDMNNGLQAIESRIQHALSLGAILMKLFSEMKKMISESVQIDTAMTQLRIVTQGGANDFAEYGRTITQTSKDIGASVTDMINSTTTFARLGYSLPDSAELARVSAMISNVGAIDVSATQNALTAITKAFNIDASQIESVMDKLVVVGNNFPVSVSELAEGMNNAGSALASAGNSFEQSIALLTAANTTVQNISKSSTGLRTITARIRGTKLELEELGEAIEIPKYEEALNILTKNKVALTDNGEFRSTYDILKDIAAVWNDLTSMEQANIAEQLSGNRQQNVFYSIVQQFQEAEGAMEAMASSDGVLQKSYDVFMNSTQAKLNQMKATFQDLSTSIFDSSMMGGFADAGSEALSVFSTLLKMLNDIGVLLPGIIALMAGIAGPAIIAGFTKLFASFGGFNLMWAGIAGGVALVVEGVTYFSKRLDEARVSAAKAGQELTSAFSSDNLDAERAITRISELKEKIDNGSLSSKELYEAQSELLSIQSELSEKYGEQADGLHLLSMSAEEAAESIRNLNSAQQAQAGSDYLTKNSGAIKRATAAMEEERDYISEQLVVNNKYASEVDSFYSKLSELADKYSAVELYRGADEYGLDSIFLRVNGDAREAEDTIKQFAAEFRKLSAEYDKSGTKVENLFRHTNYASFDSMFEKGLSDADTIIQKYGEIYDTAILSKIASEDSFATVFDKYKTAQEDYNKATTGVFDSEEERANAVSKAIKKIAEAKESLKKADFTGNDGVREYLTNLITELEDSSEKEELKLKFRFDLESSKGAITDYKNALEEAAKLGVDKSKTVFGNIDMANRQVLEWTSDNIAKYKSAIDSWGYDVKDLIGGVSTVLGTSAEYDGQEIAFTPILQTENGPVLLSSSMIDKYITGLIDKASSDGSWTNEELFALDTKGLEVDGVVIKNMLADIGNTAIQTGKKMHYLGAEGELAQLESQTSMVTDLVGAFSAFADENGEFTLSQIKAIGQLIDEGVESKDVTDELRESWKTLNEYSDQYDMTLEDLTKAMVESGYVQSDAANGADQFAGSIGKVAKELEAATERYNAYKQALEGGEMGDLMSQYASAYNKFKEDMEAGRTGSNAVRAAVNLLLPTDRLADLGYDLAAAAQELSKPVYEAIFTDEGNYGENFVNYLHDTFGAGVEGVFSIVENGNGTMDFFVNDWDALADLLKLDKDLFAALRDELDLYGPQITQSDAEVKALAKDLGLLATDAPVDNIQRVQQAIEGLAEITTDPTKIRAYLDNLAKAGYLDTDAVNEVSKEIQSIIESVNSAEKEEPNLKISSNAPEIKSELDDINNTKLADKSFTVTMKTNFGGKLGIKGSAKAISIDDVDDVQASGTKDARGGRTLVNELGPELISENGQAYIAGGGKPTVVDLDPHAIVLNAEDTKKALNGGNRKLYKGIPIRAAALSLNTRVNIDDGASKKKVTSAVNDLFTTIESAVSAATVTIGGSNNGGGNGGHGGGVGGGSSKSGSNWFEEQYAEHKHLLEMDKESEQDFLDWLDDAYKRAYEEQLFDLKEYRKY